MSSRCSLTPAYDYSRHFGWAVKNVLTSICLPNFSIPRYRLMLFTTGSLHSWEKCTAPKYLCSIFHLSHFTLLSKINEALFPCRAQWGHFIHLWQRHLSHNLYFMLESSTLCFFFLSLYTVRFNLCLTKF